MNARQKTAILCLLQLFSMNCKFKIVSFPGVQVASGQAIEAVRKA